MKNSNDNILCNENAKREIIPNLIRRVILPFYIPVISLICSFLFLNSRKIYLNKFVIYTTNFLLLVLTELFIKYTGMNYQVRYFYILLPFTLIIISYLILIFKLKNYKKIYE